MSLAQFGGNTPIGTVRGKHIYPDPAFIRWLSTIETRTGGSGDVSVTIGALAAATGPIAINADFAPGGDPVSINAQGFDGQPVSVVTGPAINGAPI